MSASPAPPLFDRELSWLSFNERVLQEADDVQVPLLERLVFLAIFSSNLDEFFRVRVASHRSLLRLKKKTRDKLGYHPRKLLKQIHRTVTSQQETFGAILRSQVLPALEAEGIGLVDEQALSDAQRRFVQDYFRRHVRPLIEPATLGTPGTNPFLKNKALYLVTELWPADGSFMLEAAEPQYVLVEIPSPPVPRFVELPAEEGRNEVLFLDDVIRANLDDLFPEQEVGTAYAIKLSRDAELYLEDEFEGSLVEKIKKSLAKRETGTPTRFLYDLRAPYALITYLKTCFDLADEDLVAGGRYHNLNDFFGFPRFGRDDLCFEPMPPLPHPELEHAPSMVAAIAERDRLLHVPYQRFDYVIRFLEEAAQDPDVEQIWITLYRVASDSAVTQALLHAAAQGKRVTAFVEVKARFDEEPNLQWAEQLEQAGVQVVYSFPDLKVHTKLALVARREAGGERLYAYLATGNFNEKTARVYGDLGLFTADPRLTQDVRGVFEQLTDQTADPSYQHLFVAPKHMRQDFYRLIDREIEQARAGQPAAMTLKMNSLEDEDIIARLYEASQAGVAIRILVRGICRLVPGVEGVSERIEVRSIVGRFLEHARIYRFHNAGDPLVYLASADWMKRNLSRRVEVAFPILDPALRQEVEAFLDLQWADNVKARHIDAQQKNAYVEAEPGAPAIDAQAETYRQLAERLAMADAEAG